MKIKQLVINEHTIKEDSNEVFTAMDAIISKMVHEQSDITIDDSRVTTIKDLRNFFNDNVLLNIELRNLPKLSSLEGLPDHMNDLSISRCDKLTDISEVNDCKSITSMTITQCKNISTIESSVGINTAISISSNNNLKKISIKANADYCDFHCQFNPKLESIDVDSSLDLDLVEILECPLLLANPQNIKVKCNKFMLSTSNDINLNEMSNVETSALQLKKYNNTFGQIYGLSRIIKMSASKLGAFQYPTNISDDMENAFKIVNQVIELPDNVRVKLMKFTQLMTEAGLDRYL